VLKGRGLQEQIGGGRYVFVTPSAGRKFFSKKNKKNLAQVLSIDNVLMFFRDGGGKD